MSIATLKNSKEIEAEIIRIQTGPLCRNPGEILLTLNAICSLQAAYQTALLLEFFTDKGFERGAK